jgi:hypothetical protein
MTELRAALSECKITLSKKVIDVFLNRTNPNGDLLLNLGLGYNWDYFLMTAAVFMNWVTEFERVDNDKDKCVTLLYDQFMDIVNRCTN